MGIKEIWAGVVSAIDTEYDRRIKAASNLRSYHIGGHDHHGAAAAHDHHDLHDQAHDHPATGATVPLTPDRLPSADLSGPAAESHPDATADGAGSASH